MQLVSSTDVETAHSAAHTRQFPSGLKHAGPAAVARGSTRQHGVAIEQHNGSGSGVTIFLRQIPAESADKIKGEDILHSQLAAAAELPLNRVRQPLLLTTTECHATTPTRVPVDCPQAPALDPVHPSSLVVTRSSTVTRGHEFSDEPDGDVNTCCSSLLYPASIHEVALVQITPCPGCLELEAKGFHS